jgi:hypothetical protein
MGWLSCVRDDGEREGIFAIDGESFVRHLFVYGEVVWIAEVGVECQPGEGGNLEPASGAGDAGGVGAVGGT